MALDNADALAILRIVVALPIENLMLQNRIGRSRHIGLIAYNFRPLSGLTRTTRRSTTLMRTVALAAILGPHLLLQQKAAKIDAQAREIQDLRARLARLEAASFFSSNRPRMIAESAARRPAVQRFPPVPLMRPL